MANSEIADPSARGSTSVDGRYVPGAVIAGKYRLEAPIGEGGMGTVWRACNLTLDAPVALKLIRPDLQREEMIRRLLTEAQVEARLKHPNLVRVFDFGETEFGHSFIVMELLDGVSLGDLMEQRGRLEPIEAVQLMLPVVSALCHAHDNGVVHRDLKPHNIFLDRVGLHTAPKLLDFGIAKLTDTPELHATEGGTLLGSPAYMAPEQAQGSGNVDHRADVWAICVVLYEAVSGTAAFPGEGYAVLRSVISNELEPLIDRSAGEDTLWPILARGLEKDPARRYQSMLELGRALAQWLSDQGETEDLDGNRIARSWNLGHERGLGRDVGGDGFAAELDCARPQGELELLEFGHDATWPGDRAPMQQQHGARLGGGLVALAAAIVLMWSPSHTVSKPGFDPAPRQASAQTRPAQAVAAVLEPREALEQLALEHVEAERSTALLARTTRDEAAAQPAEVDPDASGASKRHRKRSAEAELGLKVPY